MDNSKEAINDQVSKFLEIIEEIKSTNKLLRLEPKNNHAIASLVYPSDKSIFTKLKNGQRSKVPFDALINLAKYFKVDMNYMFYDDFHINYNPMVSKATAYGKSQQAVFSDQELKTFNSNEYKSLSLMIGMYEKIEELVKTIKESNIYASNKK